MTNVVTVREAGLDKFYTIPHIAEMCIATIGHIFEWDSWDMVYEPSAGNGSFYTRLPVPPIKKIGIDIAPEHNDILKQDFLTYVPPMNTSQRVLVVGNPPFGKISSLAIKFFNHSATFASTIAFILPRTFRRISVQNKLDMRFRLVHDEDIPTTPCSFDPPMLVKCCFQIWSKTTDNTLRKPITLATTHRDWDFLPFGPLDNKGQPTPPNGASFAIRAYGGKCGDIVQSDGLARLRPKSWHWIKAKEDPVAPNVEELIRRFSSLDYSLSKNTARQNSIGRGELVRLYNSADFTV